MKRHLTLPAGQSRPPRFLLIESRGHWSEPSTRRFLVSALTLAESGTETVLFLVQDGVSHATGANAELAALVEAGGQVWVDSFSLGYWGLAGRELVPGAEEACMDDVCRLLLDPGTRTVWH
jgi:predicted peroxiredoxin